MNMLKRQTLRWFSGLVALLLLCANGLAWGPNNTDLDAAVSTGDFGAYLVNLSTWLAQQAPADSGRVSAAVLPALLKEPLLANALDQRQLIFKTGADKLGAFAQGDPASRPFLIWLLKNTPAMELYLEGAVPIGLAAREANTYTLPITALEIWMQILKADPDAKEGLYLKLAIATALAPPGSINIGAGGAKTPAAPVARYQHFKTAHQHKELFPSFDQLTVWEYTKVVSSGASDSDLAWAREMINTWRPDLRGDEMVVNSTSFVWRRAAPAPFWREGVGFDGTFKNVLAGGGKCGPRSSWSQMICHAFGIPAIGVGQPAHACVAYKAANPMTEPQPGSAWKVGFGRGWQVSKLEGMSGPDFLAGVHEREHAAEFSQVEHLRWFAAALAAPASASAVMAIAHQIQKSVPAATTELTASLKPEEAETDPGVKAAANASPTKASQAAAQPTQSGAPIKAVAGVIRVEAAAFAQTGGAISWGGQYPNVLVQDCFTGGKQVFFQQQMKSQWADYILEVPMSGTYEITMKAAVINVDQALEVGSGTNVIATVPIPLSYGLWQETQPVELKLAKGRQTLRVQTSTTEHKRGIALRSFELKVK